MKAGRLKDALLKEGLTSFCYLTGNKLKNRVPDEEKYSRWMKQEERMIEQVVKEDSALISYQAGFDVVIVGESKHLKDTIDSLSNQSYQPKEIFLISEQNNHINPACKQARDLQQAVELSKAEYIGFVKAGDILHKHCLFWFVRHLQIMKNRKEDFIYSDEDELSAKGGRFHPYFKPDYSPDTLRSVFYIGGFFCVKKERLVDLLTQYQDWNLSQDWWDYELVLRLVSKDIIVGHLDEVLYHRRLRQLDMNTLVAMKEKWLQDNHIHAHVEYKEDSQIAGIIYDMEEPKPLISFIIPSKDNPSLLNTCLTSIKNRTTYPNIEIIVVDNGGTEENKKKYKEILEHCGLSFQYHYESFSFNFSRMCNIGAGLAKGQLLVFLNDDIEVCQETLPDCLDRMAGHALQQHIGVVGAKLYYPDTSMIQHTGLINYKSGIAHTLSHEDDKVFWDHKRNHMERNYLAVTGACMMLRRDTFEQVGGFDESLAVTFNDVELCYRVSKMGLFCVVRNDAVLYHHESITRGEDAVDEKKLLRSLEERQKLFTMHPEFIYQDPYYSRHQSQVFLTNGINMQENQVVSKAMKSIKPDSSQSESLIWNIESVSMSDMVKIEGYAFMTGERYNNCNQCYIVLEDDKQNKTFFQTKREYDPMLAKLLKIEQKINLCSFSVKIDPMLMNGNYHIGIYLKNAISGKSAHVMDNTRVLAIPSDFRYDNERKIRER